MTENGESPEARGQAQDGSAVRRVFKNAGLLLSGKLTTGLIQLASLALAARGLGLDGFGTFILVQTYVQILAGVTTFQSWQLLIRFGAQDLAENRLADFQALIKFSTVLDVAGAFIGVAVGVLLAPWLGRAMGWDAETIFLAQLYSVLVLSYAVATPTGLLRLYDKFGMLAWQVVITPGLRLAGVAIAFALEAPIWAYWLSWFVAGFIGSFVLIWLGWREAARAGHLYALNRSLAGITQRHEGLWRFALLSNLQSSLTTVHGYLTTLVVGAVGSAAQAGLFRIAWEIATSLVKPAELLNQATYPELARMASRRGFAEMTHLIVRSSLGVAVGSAALLALAAVIGKPALELAFGVGFGEAYSVLLLLTAAAGISMSGFAFVPTLYAMGRPGAPLVVNILLTLAYLPALYWLAVRTQAVGAGWAQIGLQTATFAILFVMTWRVMARAMRPSAS
jgi:O-antigen/teichoic acid export membrane protein